MKRTAPALFAFLVLVSSLGSCRKSGGVSGTITIAPALASKVSPTAVLYVLAMKTMGPPLAVRGIPHPAFPLSYAITEKDVMMPGEKLAGPLYLIARVYMDGNAHPPTKGDMEGIAPSNPVSLGSSRADIVIDKEY